MNKIETKCCTIIDLGERIISAQYRDGYVVNLEDAIEVTDAYETLYPEGDVYILVNLKKKFLNTSIPALKYFALEANIIPRVKGNAVVLTNLPTRILVRFFMRSFKSKYTTKIFSDRLSALRWLNSLKQANENDSFKNPPNLNQNKQNESSY